MNSIVQRAIAGIIVVFGLLISLGYVLAIIFASNRQEAGEQWGALAGFALFSAAAGVAWLLALMRQGRQGEAGSTRLPPAWLSFAAFVVVVGLGFGLDAIERG